jgi:hypothetical protein
LCRGDICDPSDKAAAGAILEAEAGWEIHALIQAFATRRA